MKNENKNVFIIQTESSWDVMQDNEIVESFPIKVFEHPCCSLGSLRAMNVVKKLLGLPWIDICDYLIVKRGK